MRLMTLVVVAALAFAVAPALADKGGNGGGSVDVTIALDGDTTFVQSDSGLMVSGDATFDVTRSYPFDRETIWVTNTCWDPAGNVVVDQDNVVLWGTSISLEGTTGPMPTGGTHCTAYVTLRPWQDRPYREAIIDYSVASS